MRASAVLSLLRLWHYSLTQLSGPPQMHSCGDNQILAILHVWVWYRHATRPSLFASVWLCQTTCSEVQVIQPHLFNHLSYSGVTAMAESDHLMLPCNGPEARTEGRACVSRTPILTIDSMTWYSWLILPYFSTGVGAIWGSLRNGHPQTPNH